MKKYIKGLQALKDLMKDYYEMCQDLGNNDDQYQRCNLTSERAIIEKELKALEIIKEKGIILQFIKETYTVEQYNAGVFGTLVKPLTQEEFDLLKEVLL